jgi:phage terminase Nu1 subunit (DNA packaging protein)
LKLQNTIYIGEVIRNAYTFNFKKRRGEGMDADSLLQAVDQLFTLLYERQIDYLLVNGIAMLQYVQGRNTEDIDLIIAASSLPALPEITIAEQDENFARGTLGDLQIDFLLTRNPLFELVQRQYATVHSFRERDIPCATIEGLLLLKLYALPSLYRQGNFARVGLYENDIATLINDYQPVLAPLFEELTRHLSTSDTASLREIVAEIQQRIKRFQQGFGERE